MEPILDTMHEMRGAAVQVMTNYPIKSDEYRRAIELNDKLNELSEALTGNREAHWPIRREG